jgi:hypothetical protein
MEAASHWAVENIPSLLENPEGRYNVHKSSPTDSNLNR